MSILRSAPFLRAYRFLPHRVINGAARRITRTRRPRWAVDLAIRAWIARDEIDMRDFEDARFATVEDFFLRHLRSGARPLDEGVVSPADGRLVGAGTLHQGTLLQVKGVPLSLDRLVHGRGGDASIDLAPYRDGRWATIFLTPRGYHHVHAPLDGELVDTRWIPGRYFPQNEDALRHIDAIYERNERAALRLRAAGGDTWLLVMVGASVIGGIEIDGVSRDRWAQRRPVPLARPVRKGDRIGWFTFGSTVVVIAPRDAVGAPCFSVGDDVRMGQRLFVG